MMKPIYIKSATLLSPQDTFGASELPTVFNDTEDGKLYVVDANYRDYINPVAIRRMSRLLKMGISTGMQSLKEAGVASPDAIITGTGRGSMTDMEKFMLDMIALNEAALNPTSFIQSTYNSVNGWLALNTKSTGYNQTYVHRGHSLEMALFDGWMLLNEHNQPMNILAGSFDELTPDYYKVKSKVNYWKVPTVNSLDLHKHNTTPGTIAGEGSSFFTLSNDSTNATTELHAIKMLQSPSEEEIGTAIEEMISKIPQVDILISGENGDQQHNYIYEISDKYIDDNTTKVVFKHLSGEYDTAVGFGLWLGHKIISNQSIPESIIQKKGNGKQYEYILIVNHYILDSVSVILLKKTNH